MGSLRGNPCRPNQRNGVARLSLQGLQQQDAAEQAKKLRSYFPNLLLGSDVANVGACSCEVVLNDPERRPPDAFSSCLQVTRIVSPVLCHRCCVPCVVHAYGNCRSRSASRRWQLSLES